MEVSIITVSFNSAKTIEETIKSVLKQDYQKIEYIIVDGGSTDGTLDIIKKYKDGISKFISEPDNGIYNAMNKGIRLATGDVIAILNSDDIYADNTIISQMIEFIKNNDLDGAYGDLVYIDSANENHTSRYWKAGLYQKGAFRYGWVIPHPTFFCRKSIFDKYGYFNEGFRIAADFDLMLRFIEVNRIKIGYLPKIIVKMRTGGKANVLKGVIKGNSEIIKSFRLNGIYLSPLFFIRKPLAKILQLLQKVKISELTK